MKAMCWVFGFVCLVFLLVAYVCIFFLLRACEPVDSLVSLVSTNNLMLVMFKTAQIKERKEFHGYFEVITQESRFVLCLEMFIIFFLISQRSCHVRDYGYIL